MNTRDKLSVFVLSLVVFFTVWQFANEHRSIVIRDNSHMYVEGVVGDVKVINPLFVDFNDADRDIAQLVFSGLLRYDPVDKNFYPDLAEKIERSNDGKIVTITLRNNATWHDNIPVSTDDVLFTYRDIIQNESFRNPVLRNEFSSVMITKVDENKIKFELSEPNSYFISYLITGILPKHIYENADLGAIERSSLNSNPIGSGPYKISSMSIDSDNDYVDLVMNDNYYGKKPTTQKIRVVTFSTLDELLRESMYLNAIGKISTVDEVTDDFSKDHSKYSYSLHQFTAVYFNTDSPVLSIKKIRRALFRSLDKDKLVIDGERRVDTIEMGTSKDPQFTADVSAAEKVLDEAGFIKSPTDGMRKTPAGDSMSLTLLTHDKIPTSLAINLQEQWKKVGVNIEIQNVDTTEYYRLLESRRYDIVLNKQNLGSNLDMYPLFHSSQAYYDDKRVGLNLSNIKSFKIDTLTEALRKETSPNAKEKMYGELSEAIADEADVVLLSTPVYSYWLPKNYGAFTVNTLNYHSDRFSILPYLLSSITTK